MVDVIRMPMMGNTMEVGVLAEWLVSTSDDVTEGQPLATVESEKASRDVEATQDGTLSRIDVEAGAEVPPGTVIGVVLGPDESLEDVTIQDEPSESGGDNSTDASVADAESVGSSDGDTAQRADEHAPGPIDGSPPDRTGAAADSERETARFITPTTRRLSRVYGVRLANIDGTGICGRVTESDVRRAAGVVPDSQTGETESTASPSLTSDSDVTIREEREQSSMRRQIAERMSRSASNAPHVTMERTVSVRRAIETVEELGDDSPIGFVDLLIRAVADALAEYPEFNAWFVDNMLRLVEEQNIAIAVDVPGGLVTPTIRDTDRKTVPDLASERRELTTAVLEESYSPDVLQDATFTVSNLGMYGVSSFTPIINPPQVAILGVGEIHTQEDDLFCTLSLSFDHRVVDGVDSAQFLAKIASGIETPSALLAAAGEQTHDSTSPPRSGGNNTVTDRRAALEHIVSQDLTERAATLANDPDIGVEGVELSVSLRNSTEVDVSRGNGASDANLRRVAYAACRRSTFSDVIPGLQDPSLSIE